MIGGQTIHSAFEVPSCHSLQLHALGSGPKESLIDALREVVAVIFEEVSMIEAALLGAASYKMCCARQRSHGCDPFLYSEVGHMFGAAPIILFLGDFYQLRPMNRAFGKRESLLDQLPADAPIHKRNGQRIFLEGVNNAMFLYKTHRFVDRLVSPAVECPFMPGFLQAMRNGDRLTEEQWSTVQSWVVQPNDCRLRSGSTRDGFEMAIAWEAVAREMQYRSLREAFAAKQMLMYVQAVDICRHDLPRHEYMQMLQVVNMTNTAKMLGMCPLYIGMRVRLTVRLSEPADGAVQDAVGEVLDVIFHEREFEQPSSDWRCNPDHQARCNGYVRLKYSPQAVVVRFDDVQLDIGLGPGVLLVQVFKGNWTFNAHELIDGERVQRSRLVTRYQIPLVPEKVRTVQTAQGLGMDTATMTLAKPPNMNEDDWWLHVYVMLSRVRVAHRILVYELPPRELFERGPPAFVQSGVRRFERIMEDRTRSVAERLAVEFGWRAGGQPSAGTVGTQPEASAPAEVRPKGVSFLTQRKPEPRGRASGAVSSDVASHAGSRKHVRVGAVGSVALPSPSSAGLPSSFGEVPSALRAPQARLSKEQVDSLNPHQEISGEIMVPLGEDLMAACYSVAAPTPRWEALWSGGRGARCGIRNMGNTCFVSSVVQVLLRVAPLRSMIENHAQRCALSSATCGVCALAAQARLLLDGPVARESGAGGPPPAAVAARGGLLGAEFAAARDESGRLQDRQHDARDFAEFLLSSVAAAEGDRVPAQARMMGRESALDEHVFGRVFLQRRVCRGCGQVNDLYCWERFLRLYPKQVTGGLGSIALQDLIAWQFAYVETSPRCPLDDTGCQGPTEQHVFPKRDAPALVIVLSRTALSIGGGRDQTRVIFPQELPGLADPSARYRCAGAVCHRGPRADAGHYVAYCEVGNGLYCLFDDDAVHGPFSWGHIAHSPKVQQEAYMLMYVNIGIPGEPARGQIPGAPEAPGFAERATEARRSAAQSASSSSEGAVLPSELSLTAPAAKRRKAGAQPTEALGVPAELPCLSKGVKRKLKASPPGEGILELPEVEALAPANVSAAARDFTPPVVDHAKCFARVWANGEGGQCQNKPLDGSRFCKRHALMFQEFTAGSGKGWHGSVDGDIPAAKLMQFQSHRAKSAGVPRACGPRPDCGELEAARRTQHEAEQPRQEGSSSRAEGLGAAPTIVKGRLLRRPPRHAASSSAPASSGGRIVSGFGAERVEDVDAQRRARDAQMAQTAAARAEDGSRGRAVDMHGNELDRSEGAAWQAGR